MTVVELPSQAMLTDLAASALSPKDINAREVSPSELAATNTSTTVREGYVIPYYDLNGNPLPFYRVRLFKHDPKYKQPKNSVNHLYFPPNFRKALESAISRGQKYVILCEGEKKAACATKKGFPAVAVGGVDNWRNRTLLLPEDTILEQDHGKRKQVRAKLSSTLTNIPEAFTLAYGLVELIEFLIHRELTLVIAYDSDMGGRLKPEVQRAAAMLAYELRYRGMPARHIKQVILPDVTKSDKTGLDDYLKARGAEELKQLVSAAIKSPRAFPRHPNPKGLINARLESGGLSRKDAQEVSLSVLTELDARGKRLRSTSTGQPYYFDEVSHKLMPASLLQAGRGEPMHESSFGTFLYQEYGLSSADTRVITWLATQFMAEEPMSEVEPCRVLTLTQDNPMNPDGVAYQISDSQFVVISPDAKNPIRLLSNGSEGILFEHDQVDALDAHELLEQFKEQMHPQNKFTPWWNEVFNDTKLSNPNMQQLATLLFYISPFMQRWRGAQIPIELMVGEAGSGKSSLYALRLQILTGRPLLRNMPTDLRDWHASITNAGGLHVIDNVHFTNKELRQRLSDELCRIITEPNACIEMRKFYTNAAQVRIPVRATFAMTAIQNPFHNADLIQRSAIFDLTAVGRAPEGDWVQKQLDLRGGREAWVAHHLAFVHRFLNMANRGKMWDPHRQSVHRLGHYEQCLDIACKVFGMDNNFVKTALTKSLETNLADADWALEGIKNYVDEIRMVSNGKPFRFTSQDIAKWASESEEYAENPQLNNARRLGRYMTSHMNMLQKATGMAEVGTTGNRRVYQIK